MPRKAVKGKDKGGAPSKYDARYCPRFIGWLARDGCTHDEIAEQIGVSRDTLYRWRKEYPEVDEALKTNKAIADYKVEESAFKRACGYEYTKTEIEVSEVGNKIFKKKKETVMHVPSDPTTLIFWLCNRKPDKWKRNGSVFSGDETSTIDALMDEIKKESGKYST